MFKLMLLLGLALGASPAQAEVQALASIARVAEAEALQLGHSDAIAGLRAEAGALDPRLRLLACGEDLKARNAAGTRAGSRLTIEVSCAAPAWRVFVPVTLHARLPVLVAARPLPARTALSAADVRVVERELSGLPFGYFQRPSEIEGQEIMRPVGQGEALTPRVVRSRPLIARGQSVTLLATAGGLAVRAQGHALAAAGLNERIRVRNMSSGRDIEGIVRAPGLVEVTF